MKIMKISAETIPPKAVVYMRGIGQYGEQNYRLMQEMKRWVQSHGQWTEAGVIYGIALDNMKITPPEKCRYDVCFVTDIAYNDTAVSHGTLPSGEYLVFEVPHTADDVKKFYASIGDALTKEEKRIDESRPILERYQFALVENGYCEFCVPVL
jgi:DNA gyrase inhibitor GyrI